ncbi:MAG: EVE domain-containing protein [Pyrinomonadaceae bacterium]|nr:EVE domain-containing protein [Phycisphaerales bacterium]
MTTYLLKTEPSVFSYADLARDKKATWDGVANPAALIFLRGMRKGDEAFIYHTGDERAIVGLASVVSNPYEDPKSPGLTKDGLPKSAVIDLKPRRAAAVPVSLDLMKSDVRFKGFELLRLPRLSVMPVPPEIDRLVRELGRIA